MHDALADEEIVHPPWGLGGAQSVHCREAYHGQSQDVPKQIPRTKQSDKVIDFAWSGITGTLQWQHLWISPHAWSSGRWGNCSPTMMTGRCTECTLPWGLSWTIDKMFHNKSPNRRSVGLDISDITFFFIFCHLALSKNNRTSTGTHDASMVAWYILPRFTYIYVWYIKYHHKFQPSMDR